MGLNIGLDFHGVFVSEYEIAQRKSRLAFRRWRKDIPPEEFLRGGIVRRGLLDSERFKDLQLAVYNDWKNVKIMPPMIGMQEGVNFLYNAGHQLIVITTATGRTNDLVSRWLRKNNVSPIPIIGCEKGKSKLLRHLASEGCLNVYIDNKISILREVAGVIPYLFFFKEWFDTTRPLKSSSIITVSSWKELCFIVSEIDMRFERGEVISEIEE